MKQRLSLKGRALQLLSQREHSRLELRRKLLAHAQRLADGDPASARPARAGAARDEDLHGSTLARRAPLSPETQAGVDCLLDELAAIGLLSEARFVEARVRTRAPRHGTLRITQELSRHGLELSADEARDLKTSEFSRAKDVWARKFGAVASDVRERARQMRFLAGRGFSAEVIRRVTRAGADDD